MSKEHVFVQATDDPVRALVRCENCGAEMGVAMPLDLMRFVAIIDEFGSEHEDCP